MSQHLPVANVVAVQLRHDGNPQCLGRVTVRCPFCAHLHSHRVFTNDSLVFTRTGPCSTNTDVRRYSVDLNTQIPKRNVSQPHPVYAAGKDRDDNAMHEYENNWTE